MLLIGEVKEFAPSHSRHQLVVKHLPEFPFLLGEDLHRRMAARFEREIALWDGVAGAHLIVIAPVGVGPAGVAAVEELALMVVTDNCRVAGPRCRDPAPSEPDVTIARHPAQASAAWHPIRAWCP